MCLEGFGSNQKSQEFSLPVAVPAVTSDSLHQGSFLPILPQATVRQQSPSAWGLLTTAPAIRQGTALTLLELRSLGLFSMCCFVPSAQPPFLFCPD